MRKQKEPAYKRQVKETKDRAERLRLLVEKRDMRIAQCMEWERLENYDELRDCRRKLRNVEQQIRYINQEP